MKTLQTTCLIGVNHRHALQDLVSSDTLHHPDLKEAIGDLTLPAEMSNIALLFTGLLWEQEVRISCDRNRDILYERREVARAQGSCASAGKLRERRQVV